MAKKSAKSKGYRRTIEKKPYLTKKDIIILCVLLAAVAIGAILLFSYDDGALKTQDGRIVDAQENWLIVNGAANGGRRYFKLGALNDVDGYALTNEPGQSDENLMSHIYRPDEEGAVQSSSVTCAAAKPDRAAAYFQSLFSALDTTEVAQGTVGGVDCSYFSYHTSYYQADESGEPAGESEAAGEGAAEAQEPEPNRFDQAMHVYFPASHDYSIGIGVQASVDSKDAWLTDEQLLDIVAQIYSGIELEAK